MVTVIGPLDVLRLAEMMLQVEGCPDGFVQNRV